MRTASSCSDVRWTATATTRRRSFHFTTPRAPTSLRRQRLLTQSTMAPRRGGAGTRVGERREPRVYAHICNARDLVTLVHVTMQQSMWQRRSTKCVWVVNVGGPSMRNSKRSSGTLFFNQAPIASGLLQWMAAFLCGRLPTANSCVHDNCL